MNKNLRPPLLEKSRGGSNRGAPAHGTRSKSIEYLNREPALAVFKKCGFILLY
jgi:hypothetical protein